LRVLGVLAATSEVRHIALCVGNRRNQPSATCSDDRGLDSGQRLNTGHNDGKLRLYRALAGSVPRGENRVVEGAGHASIHWSHPGAVLQAIQDLLGT